VSKRLTVWICALLALAAMVASSVGLVTDAAAL
jgi:hypothetical protein